jgi:rubrerythrin
MGKKAANSDQIHELLYQALETERGGIKIYERAVRCAQNDDLKKEFKEYLSETKNHEKILTAVFAELGLDTETQTPGRKAVATIGEALVKAMDIAHASGDPAAMELVACECVMLAETKDHSNWELIGQIVKQHKGPEAKVLKPAYEEVEDQEDHHLYHTKGWCRELWMQSLDLPAVLPPPEEVKKVETAIGAARAEHARNKMM